MVFLLSTAHVVNAQTLVVKDELGHSVKVPAAPQRILPLAPSLAEILFALGLNERIVGVTDFTTYPEEAMTKPRVGSFINPSLEKVVALRPDLVIAGSEARFEQINVALIKLGIPCYQIKPSDLESTYRSIANLGEVTGSQEKAREVISRMRKKVAEIEAQVAGVPVKKVFYQVNVKPIISVGGKSLVADLVGRAGGLLITADIPIRYPHYSVERVIVDAPDVIVISAMAQGFNYDYFKNIWQRCESIPAVRNNQIYLIKSEIVDRASPRIIEGLAKLAEFIHPESK
ncbi:MAG: cobalamin-binding protein [Deltaproteobacteria bacterium]|nr:cobalamin-binding protein [Deltaproteobacteria bacterium]